jgi:hypothetical protein
MGYYSSNRQTEAALHIFYVLKLSQNQSQRLALFETLKIWKSCLGLSVRAVIEFIFIGENEAIWLAEEPLRAGRF